MKHLRNGQYAYLRKNQAKEHLGQHDTKNEALEFDGASAIFFAAHIKHSGHHQDRP